MSEMSKWAENEVALACKRERGSAKDEEWDYGCACYMSALKAFRSLCEDDHSGCSMQITQGILNRLIDGKVLTPIEDQPDIWHHAFDRENGNQVYQCSRMSGLFKEIDPSGSVEYNDVSRVTCFDIKSHSAYHFGVVDQVIDEMFPIKMPYHPYDKQFQVACEDFLTDKRNGDFDTVGIFYVVTPLDKKIRINRYFAESNGKFKEIGWIRYIFRKWKARRLAAK